MHNDLIILIEYKDDCLYVDKRTWCKTNILGPDTAFKCAFGHNKTCAALPVRSTPTCLCQVRSFSLNNIIWLRIVAVKLSTEFFILINCKNDRTKYSAIIMI